MLLEQDNGAAARISAEIDIHIFLADGSHFSRRAAVGKNLQDLLHDYGFPVRARRGQFDAIGNCHVRIPSRWHVLLAPPADDELDELSHISSRAENSRLAGHLAISSRLDGLEIELQPDGLIPQTYWVAG